jgi:dihydrofolate synthase/folylpolyglutamate synthase
VGQDVTWQARDRDSTGQSFLVRGRLDEYSLRMPLLGAHQLENAASAVAALESLREQGYSIPGPALAEGFARVSWPCRMEVLSQSPLVVADGAHNAYSMAALLESLPNYFDYANLLVIAGFSRDKSLQEMVALLAQGRPRVIATRSRHPRSAQPQELAGLFRDRGLDRVEAVDTVKGAVAQALKGAGPRDLILGTGSLFVAAEVREDLLGIEPERYPDLLPWDLRPSGASI